MAGGLDTGAACATDRQCRPPLRCSLNGFYGTCAEGGSVDQGGACTATADCLSGLWCGPNGQCAVLKQAYPPFAGVTCTDEGAFRAYFEVPRPGKPPADFYRLPFPNDIRVSGGALDISDFPKPGPTPLGVDLVKLYVDTWTADFDGFSAAAGIAFRFSGNIDYNSATPDVVRIVRRDRRARRSAPSSGAAGSPTTARRSIRATTRWSCATRPIRRSSRGTRTRRS